MFVLLNLIYGKVSLITLQLLFKRGGSITYRRTPLVIIMIEYAEYRKMLLATSLFVITYKGELMVPNGQGIRGCRFDAHPKHLFFFKQTTDR